uniref:Uncharacterized protein n=1 Tax=Arion vulgaris TaxID=1028688 RepID=A0A0B7B980_9EUPU
MVMERDLNVLSHASLNFILSRELMSADCFYCIFSFVYRRRILSLICHNNNNNEIY